MTSENTVDEGELARDKKNETSGESLSVDVTCKSSIASAANWASAVDQSGFFKFDSLVFKFRFFVKLIEARHRRKQKSQRLKVRLSCPVPAVAIISLRRPDKETSNVNASRKIVVSILMQVHVNSFLTNLLHNRFSQRSKYGSVRTLLFKKPT